jgi:hypothetical protein
MIKKKTQKSIEPKRAPKVDMQWYRCDMTILPAI